MRHRLDYGGREQVGEIVGLHQLAGRIVDGDDLAEAVVVPIVYGREPAVVRHEEARRPDRAKAISIKLMTATNSEIFARLCQSLWPLTTHSSQS